MSTSRTRHEASQQHDTDSRRVTVTLGGQQVQVSRAEAWEAVGVLVREALGGGELQARHAWLAEAQRTGYARAVTEALSVARENAADPDGGAAAVVTWLRAR